MKKAKKYIGFCIAVLSAPLITYGVYKTNVNASFESKNIQSFLFNEKNEQLSITSNNGKTNNSLSIKLDFSLKIKNVNLPNKDMLKSSKISNGYHGKIWEDYRGDLYAISYQNELQVLKKGRNEWELASKYNASFGSGWGISVLQDSRGNIWCMGKDAPLQVLRKGQTRWELAGHNSNIDTGWLGSITEDLDGNIFAIGPGKPLQVLRKGQNQWEVSSSLITFETFGGAKILADSRGDVWALVENLPLQVLRRNKNIWSEAKHNSNIVNGAYGFLHEDKEGNLWASGGISREVLKNGSTEWKNAYPFLGISLARSMLQDSQLRLWVSSSGGVVGYRKEGDFFNRFDKIKPPYWNSNITDGQYGCIIEDSTDNIWSMGMDNALQVLMKNKFKWKEAKNNSNIINGNSGTIFEDSIGNLWSMGVETPLQMKPLGLKNWIEFSEQQATKYSTYKIVKENINISSTYYLNVKNNKFYIKGDYLRKSKFIKIKYKQLNQTQWKSFNKTGTSNEKILPGEYQFKWVINNNLELAPGSNALPVIPNQKVINASEISGIPSASKKTTSYIGANDGKIILPITGLPKGINIVVTKNDKVITDLNNLKPGTYKIEYVLEKNAFLIGNIPSNPMYLTITQSKNIGVIAPKNVRISATRDQVSHKGALDGQIKVSGIIPLGAKLQYQKDGEVIWKDILNNQVNGLSSGTYHFKYVLEKNHVWISGSPLKIKDITIKEGKAIIIDTKNNKSFIAKKVLYVLASIFSIFAILPFLYKINRKNKKQNN